MTRRKEMEAGLRKAMEAETAAEAAKAAEAAGTGAQTTEATLPKPTRHRVSNDVGALISGVPGRRRVMLLYRPAWRDLHSVDDLWISVRAQAVRLLLGVVEMTSTKEGLYVVTTATAHDGYASMLKALTSGVAREDVVGILDYLGVKISPRRFGPYAGMRRRGAQSLKALQRAHNLEDRTMHQIVDRIRDAFLARVTAPLDEV